jgi:DNA-binding SARP family transcriptional activator
MKVVIQELAKEANIELTKIEECKTEIIKAIYEAYLATNDRSDTIDSLERAVRKISRTNSPLGGESPK